MKHNRYIQIAILMAFILSGCGRQENTFDASGSFEAVETIISSEASGILLEFAVEEGMTLGQGQIVGMVDTVQLALRKKQIEAQIKALGSKKPNVEVQLGALKDQLKTAESEQKRINKLVQADAVPEKQLDDINAQIAFLKKQIEAQRSSLNISTTSIDKESAPLELQIAQIEDQLSRCKITNPISGTVLTKYAETHELVGTGKPLYKIANLQNMILRVYITGDQLSSVKLNQKVKVITDDGSGGSKETSGNITWINNEAEFTPKTIQTKDERANLVYAIKVVVQNDGSYKPGMYGEIMFQP